MKDKRALALTATAAFVAMLAAGPAQANLELVAAIDFGGTGLGAANTILTIQSPARSSFEAGSVGRAPGDPNDVITGDAKTGASQTQTRTFGELGITDADDLRVVFNALEPAGNSILLSSLQLSIFDTSGALVFNSGAVTCPSLGGVCNFADTFTGAGNSGFVFALDAAQAAIAEPFVVAGNRIGLSASAANATGGFETFFVANVPGSVTPIPEPETYALMLAGLGALGFVAKRRRRNA